IPANSARSASAQVASSPRSRVRSARSVSAWELTETYSPAAMESAPATRPATAASKTPAPLGSAAATPTIKLLVEIRPSLAPSTAARSQPIRWLRWNSPGMIGPWRWRQSEATSRPALRLRACGGGCASADQYPARLPPRQRPVSSKRGLFAHQGASALVLYVGELDPDADGKYKRSGALV